MTIQNICETIAEYAGFPPEEVPVIGTVVESCLRQREVTLIFNEKLLTREDVLKALNPDFSPQKKRRKIN